MYYMFYAAHERLLLYYRRRKPVRSQVSQQAHTLSINAPVYILMAALFLSPSFRHNPSLIGTSGHSSGVFFFKSVANISANSYFHIFFLVTKITKIFSVSLK